MINIKEDEKLSIMNHSCAHLLAQAIKHLYPQAKFWVGPVITDGFYYDIDLDDKVISEADFPVIEHEMKKIAKDGKRIVRHEISRSEALEMFKDDPYKIDLINNFAEDETISCYTQGDFTDLCRGPHVETVKELKYFKLLKVSGAYWKGDINNKMLQRVYGICFDSQEKLDEYLTMLEEAKKRDHRKLGREMGLFMFSEYGPGFPFWLPNGMILRQQLLDFWHREHIKEDYVEISTPVILSRELWETSGHWDHYRNNMYTTEIDEKDFAIKPMNCPGSILVYKNEPHSYKDLPLRYAELGLVHRHEASGALNGLFRVRAFTQDDAHMFMTEEQIEGEILRLIAFIDRVYAVFKLPYSIELSTRPEKDYVGDIAVWDHAEVILKEACEKSGHAWKINPGDGAFYGPKLDFHVTDSLGRVWQCGTIQLDFNLPERFDMNYIAADNSKKRPVMIHRVIFGSVERFIGILIEHYGGNFPLWLAPQQIVVIPVNPGVHSEYAKQVADRLAAQNFRVKIDDRNEKLGYRVREDQMQRIPVQLVVGDNEAANASVTVRRHNQTAQQTMTLDEFVSAALQEVEKKI